MHISTSETSDKVLSITRVTLANQCKGRWKSYIKAESVACQFCRNSQTVHTNYRSFYCVHIVHAYIVTY